MLLYHSKSAIGDDIVNESKCEVMSLISSPGEDRQGDILLPLGCDLTEYKTNPVVLFNHGKNWALPIAMALSDQGECTVQPREDGIYATSKFIQSNAFAMEVFDMCVKGYLRGWSVGFQAFPDGVKKVRNAQTGAVNTVFERYKMFEYSATPTPVNAEALTVAVQKSLSPLVKEAFADFVLPKPGIYNGVTIQQINKGATMEPKKDDELKPDTKSADAGETTPSDEIKPAEETPAEEKKQMRPTAALISKYIDGLRQTRGMLMNEMDNIDKGAGYDALTEALEMHKGLEELIMGKAGEYDEELKFDAIDDEELKSMCKKKADKPIMEADEEATMEVKGLTFTPWRLVIKSGTDGYAPKPKASQGKAALQKALEQKKAYEAAKKRLNRSLEEAKKIGA